MIYFSKNLLYLRSKKSMTLAELAKETGFSTSQLNNYELGTSYPKFLDLIKISSYFAISESELIHKNLEIIQDLSTYQEKNQEKIIALQSKLIIFQDEKIRNLESKIKELEKKITI